MYDFAIEKLNEALTHEVAVLAAYLMVRNTSRSFERDKKRNIEELESALQKLTE